MQMEVAGLAGSLGPSAPDGRLFRSPCPRVPPGWKGPWLVRVPVSSHSHTSVRLLPRSEGRGRTPEAAHQPHVWPRLGPGCWKESHHCLLSANGETESQAVGCGACSPGPGLCPQGPAPSEDGWAGVTVLLPGLRGHLSRDAWPWWPCASGRGQHSHTHGPEVLGWGRTCTHPSSRFVDETRQSLESS